MKPRLFISTAAAQAYLHGSISFRTQQITSINQAVAEGRLSSPAGHEDKWMLASAAICILLLSESYRAVQTVKASQEPQNIWWTRNSLGGLPCPASVDYPGSADILSSIFHLLYIFVALISGVDKHTGPPHSPVWMNNRSKAHDHRGICPPSRGPASALCKPASAEAMSNEAVTQGWMSLSAGERQTLRRLPRVYFTRYSQVFNNFRS